MEIAYAWFGVAAHLGNTQAATKKKTAAATLSGDALRKAESLATDYIDRYGKELGWGFAGWVRAIARNLPN